MDQDEYETGYKKPPKNGQFQKGTSGNPTGRPKGSKNMATIIEEELNRELLVTENGEQLSISAKQFFIRMLVAKAVKGDLKAIDCLMKIIESGNKIYFF